MSARAIAPLLAVFAFGTASAANVTCYEEPGSRKMTCIDEAAVDANGSIRSSPLYTGGPNGVKKTPYRMLVDCDRKVTTLQDSAGVNFAGASSGAAPASESLSSTMCAVAKPKKNPKLRQF